MELKVRAVDGIEEKSIAQVEEELLEKHEEQFEDSTPKEEVVEQVVETTEPEGLTEEQVLSHIKNRYNKEISSMDELFAERESQQLLLIYHPAP